MLTMRDVNNKLLLIELQRPFGCSHDEVVVHCGKKSLFRLCITTEYVHVFREGDLGTVMVSLKDKSVVH